MHQIQSWSQLPAIQGTSLATKGKSQSLSSGDLSTIKSLTQISLKSQSTLSLSALKPHHCQWKTLMGEVGAFPVLPTSNGMNLCRDPVVLLITLRATHWWPLTNTSIIANFVSFFVPRRLSAFPRHLFSVLLTELLTLSQSLPLTYFSLTSTSPTLVLFHFSTVTFPLLRIPWFFLMHPTSDAHYILLCHIPGNIWGQFGGGPEQPGLVEDFPGYCRD